MKMGSFCQVNVDQEAMANTKRLLLQSKFSCDCLLGVVRSPWTKTSAFWWRERFCTVQQWKLLLLCKCPMSVKWRHHVKWRHKMSGYDVIQHKNHKKQLSSSWYLDLYKFHEWHRMLINEEKSIDNVFACCLSTQDAWNTMTGFDKAVLSCAAILTNIETTPRIFTPVLPKRTSVR